MRALRELLRREDGPTAVEYAVLLAMIILLCVVAVMGVGNAARMMWNDNGSKLNSAW